MTHSKTASTVAPSDQQQHTTTSTNVKLLHS